MDYFRYISVQNIEFQQIYVFGEYLPSLSSIEDAIKIYDTKDKKIKFRKFSNNFNQWSSYHHHHEIPFNILDENSYLEWFNNLGDINKISYSQAETIYVKMIERKCKITGHDFRLVVQNQHVLEWYQCLYGNYGNGNEKQVREMSNIFLKGSETESYERFIDFQNKEKLRYSYLRDKYQDYAKAEKYYSEFFALNHVPILLDSKKTIEQANGNIAGIRGEIAKILKNSQNYGHQKQMFFCHKCQSHSFAKAGKLQSFCDSCNKLKDAENKAKRNVDRKGWVFDRIGACQGGCGSLKIKINTLEICWSCYSSNPM
jgi:hypothetical protein